MYCQVEIEDVYEDQNYQDINRDNHLQLDFKLGENLQFNGQTGPDKSLHSGEDASRYPVQYEHKCSMIGKILEKKGASKTKRKWT